MGIAVNAVQATNEIARSIRKKLVPILRGSPGEGKSDIVRSVAKMYNLKVIDIRLAQADPADLMGFPTINGKKAGYLPMDTFPIEGDPLPINEETGQPYAGWLLFFDELTSAVRALQAAAYKIILDRMVGIYHLHTNVAIVCAGNLETDNAIVEPMSTALQSRLVHFELGKDMDCWLEWAAEHGIDHRITSFIKFKPTSLYAFDPDHSDHTYGCPRTWEFANRFIKDEEISSELLPCLAGTLSEGLAREFIGFCSIYEDLPTMKQIMDSPQTIKVSEEPSVLFALTGAISHYANKENLVKLMEYVVRLPIEFQVVTIREILRRNKELVSTPALQAWIVKNANELY
jgi:hypothetical protein